MRLVVARIGRAHGIKGEVTIEVRTDAPRERFVPGAIFHVEGGAAATASTGRPPTLTLTGARNHNGVYLLAFDGVHDRSRADALRGAVLEADLPDAAPESDAWYDHELVGLRALDPAGELLGEVLAVQHAPAQDLLVVRRTGGAKRLVPFVTAIVPRVDIAAGVIVIDAPPGLLDDVE